MPRDKVNFSTPRAEAFCKDFVPAAFEFFARERFPLMSCSLPGIRVGHTSDHSNMRASGMLDAQGACEMSTICVICPTCGGQDVSTRIVSLVLARCTCQKCHHSWIVPVERPTE